ncbi:methylamine utilization protein MauJ [Priestia megaterium]|uniref:methylamine utilization protein MauJ n=1 Tax=Priestia megaterium TaxID=1404 RepID=UPI000D506B89|nr:methylamine utilization protein MauJ [Priestia megaterium]PVE71148.1 hypothetical protein DC428_11985 [Priestia megaterium]PVE89203.1 hypothetical protein DC421_03830 [Priestia megaterium]PVE92181.1 hypothetical protein DC433_26300 [Priestia megaterium]PVE92893.1 hypothetical protein DC426_05485 [Priestia megaterium]
MSGNEFMDNLISLFRFRLVDDKLIYGRMHEIEILEVDRVLELFHEIEKIPENKFTIYYKNNDKEIAEVAASLDNKGLRILDDEGIHIKNEDNINQITYEISENVSDYYIVWLYKKMFEKYRFNARTVMTRRIQNVFSHRVRSRFETGEEVKESPLLDYMRRAVRCTTLKVTKQKGSIINLDEAIDSFHYTYMYNVENPIKVYSVEEIIRVLSAYEEARDIDFEAPKRKYNPNLIDYYNLAISSKDPFISFISYYHIIEYYFDAVFREQQINTLRASITSPRFSYKDDDQLLGIIEKIKKDNKLVRENGSGNEHQSLNYVLHKFIYDLDDYKQRLSDEELNFYQNHNVSFSAGDIITWNKDKDKILKAISNRIYKTRNALIHSKSSKKDVTYHPYLHKIELEKEISLIKTVAEHIIENDSKLLE